MTDEIQPEPVAFAPTEVPAPTKVPVPTEVLVCVKCLRGLDAPPDGARPGRMLYDALVQHDMPEGVTIRPMECLQNCDSGCSVAIRGGDARWTYVYGNFLEAEHSDMLAEGIALYHATDDGLIPWRARPEHFKRNCIARIPPTTPAASKEA